MVSDAEIFPWVTCPFYRQHKAVSQQENFSLDHFSKIQTMGLPSLLSRDYSTILIHLTIRYIFLVIRLNFPLLNFIPEKCIPWLQYETLAGSKLTMCLFASTKQNNLECSGFIHFILKDFICYKAHHFST